MIVIVTLWLDCFASTPAFLLGVACCCHWCCQILEIWFGFGSSPIAKQGSFVVFAKHNA